MVSFRIGPDELEAVDKIVTQVQKRYSFMNRSDVLRELVGLSNSGVVTKAMRDSLVVLRPAAQSDSGVPALLLENRKSRRE